MGPMSQDVVCRHDSNVMYMGCVFVYMHCA
jgi:hypothetical protein